MKQKSKRVGWAFAPTLQQWRDRYGYSQAELAQRAQVSRATISRAEQGRRIAPKQADAIAAVFGVPRARLAQAPDQEDVLPGPLPDLPSTSVEAASSSLTPSGVTQPE